MIWTTETYRLYLQSQHWAGMRQKALQAASHRCARCGTGRKPRVILDVHHLTYERIGAERLVDLEVLCRACHGSEHGIEPIAPAPRTGWNWEHVGSILPRVLHRLGLAVNAGAG